MKNIALIFIGAVRECFDDISENINCLKNCVKQHNHHVFLSTWLPEKQPQFLLNGENYVYDYDVDKLKTNDLVDTFLIYKQNNLNEYPLLQNSMPPITLYNMIKVSESLKQNNIKFDYVVMSRHDTLIEIDEIETYFNDDFNIPPLYWINNFKFSHEMINDHFFITSYDNFLKYGSSSEEQIEHMVKNSWNYETLSSVFMKNISNINFIKEQDIKKYICRKCRKYKI